MIGDYEEKELQCSYCNNSKKLKIVKESSTKLSYCYICKDITIYRLIKDV